MVGREFALVERRGSVQEMEESEPVKKERDVLEVKR